MRLLSFRRKEAPEQSSWGAYLSETESVVDLGRNPEFPADLLSFISGPIGLRNAAANAVAQSATADRLAISDIMLLPPLPRPNSLRDFYAFEQHVATAHANRGRDVPPEWYEIPVFYFSNPFSAFGHEMEIKRPSFTRELDYELEIAAVIGIPGRDIQPDTALEHIVGFMIFNDWSARDVQRQEMRVGLGPAKGKDFASSFGPWLVTPDELAPFAAGRPGVYDLEMVARINGQETSRGNWKDIHYDFGQILARASAAVTLYPGDIIGSGTVGTGCLLETTRAKGPWLQPGDVVELEVEQLGTLRNTVS